MIIEQVQELTDQIQLSIWNREFEGLHYPDIRTTVDDDASELFQLLTPCEKNERIARKEELVRAQMEMQNQWDGGSEEAMQADNAEETTSVDNTEEIIPAEDNKQALQTPRTGGAMNDKRVVHLKEKNLKWAYVGHIREMTYVDGKELRVCGLENRKRNQIRFYKS